jgi:hypothetical protein
MGTNASVLSPRVRDLLRVSGHAVPCRGCSRLAVGRSAYCCGPCEDQAGAMALIELHDATCELHDQIRQEAG